MAVKKKEGERLDDEHIEKVIAHLENGGTKKEAYDILNIKANPTRLQKIIDEYHSKVELRSRLRKENRGKPASNSDIQTIIQGALDGESLESIAESLFRPVSFVKNIIERVGIPRKLPGEYWDRRYLTSIPDACVATSFSKYEIVWSNKYNGLAIVLGKDEKGVYQIYVIEKVTVEPEFALNGKVYTGYGGHHAFQRPEELGSLEHLKQYGIDLYKPYRAYFPNWLGKA